MNKTHTVIWNASKACWTVASECARRGKSGVSGARAVLAAVAAAGLSALAPQALAAPTNGTVTHGSAFIWQDNPGNVAGRPTNTVISQTTSKAVINWNTFDVAGNESVTFNHMDPSHMTLNNVTRAWPLNISGRDQRRRQGLPGQPERHRFQQHRAGQRGQPGRLDACHRSHRVLQQHQRRLQLRGASRRTTWSATGLHHLRLGRDIVLLGHRAINGGSIQTNGGSVALGEAGSFTVRLAIARSA